MRVLLPLVLSLGVVAAGGTADAQQDAQEEFTRQVQESATRMQSSDGQAMQKQIDEATTAARQEAGVPAASSAAPTVTTTQNLTPSGGGGQVQYVPPSSSRSSMGTSGGGASTGVSPSASASGAQPAATRPPAPTPTAAGKAGRGASAPFANEYYARFDPGVRQLQQQPPQKIETLELRGAIADASETASAPEKVDPELAQELRRLEQEDRTKAGRSAGKAGRNRQPFVEPDAPQVASQKAHRSARQDFEALN